MHRLRRRRGAWSCGGNPRRTKASTYRAERYSSGSLQGAVGKLAPIHAGRAEVFDSLDPVHDGGVVALKRPADLREGMPSAVAGKPHSEHARAESGAAAPAENIGLRGARDPAGDIEAVGDRRLALVPLGGVLEAGPEGVA